MITFMQDYTEGIVRLYFTNAEKIAFKIGGFVRDSVFEDTSTQRVRTKTWGIFKLL